MPRKRKSRIYWRNGRAWADLRDFADVGGKREALKPEGESQATTDADEAAKLLADRLEELEEARRQGVTTTRRHRTLAEYAQHHLIEMARGIEASDDWIAQTEYQLQRAIEFFGAGRELTSIRPSHARDYINHLRKVPNGRGRKLSDGSIRHYINSLSGLYRRAQEDEVVPVGYNPVAVLSTKPSARPKRSKIQWLEIHDAALLLEAARLYDAEGVDGRLQFAHPLIATFLLTGALYDAVLGLEVGDVNFKREIVRFYPNQHRRLKTPYRHRDVPLWPQLREILEAYLEGRGAPAADELLFPSPRTGGMIRDIRKTLDAVAEWAGWKPGEIRTKLFRKTYCAARLQTLDNGQPVSEFTVTREMGHSSPAMVRAIYGQLGTVRHRSEVVEYRVSQHMGVEGYKDRVKVLREKGGLKLLA